MKSKIVLFATFLCAFFASHAQELIQDKTFKRRFYNHASGTNTFVQTIGCVNEGSPTVWNVAEWDSHSSFLNMQPATTNTGMCRFANNYKDFRFGGPDGAEEYDIYFAVNSQAEYNNIYRTAGAPWSHLLVEQRLSPPYDHTGQGPGCPGLNKLQALDFKIEAKLYYNQTIQNTGYDPSLHAAQFLIYFTVQNLNPTSTGYGKYIWLGLPLYDDRTPSVPGSLSFDIGTQMLISTIPYQNIASTSMHEGTWVSINVNLHPYAIQALQAAWNQGALTESYDLADYKIGGMNMGWELPGMNISTVAVRNMSLRAYEAPDCPTGRKDISGLVSTTSVATLVYPNPAEHIITFSGEKIQQISIMNSLGEKMVSPAIGQFQENERQIDISSFPIGVYVGIIETQNGIEKVKFIKH